MTLSIQVVLDSGGTITITGEDLTAEDVNEVFTILSGKQIGSAVTTEMKAAFADGFEEGRPSE